MFHALRQDIAFAARTLGRTPGFTSAVVVTLGLGIGATTAVFSVVDGVLLRPAPFADLDRLVAVWETDRDAGTTREPSSVPDFIDFRERNRRFEGLAAVMPAEVSLTSDTGDPERLAALAVTHGFLPVVGLKPLAGRAITEAEDRPGAPRVAMISEALWADRFGRAAELEGLTIRLNDVVHEVVGVLPGSADFGTLQILGAAAYGRGFAERGGRVRADVWLPLRLDAASSPRDTHPIIVLGRLRAGATVVQAQQEMTAITADLERLHPSNQARGAFVEPLEDVVFGPTRPALGVLIGAAVLLLFTACVNVANLLLARGVARAREVAVRAALGASRWRLARQFLVEGALLAGAGAVVGVSAAAAGLDVLLALAPGDVPRIDTVSINLGVLAATLVAATLAAGIFALIPLLQTMGLDLRSFLQGTTGRSSFGRGQARLRASLVVAELAMAVVLLSGAGLLVRSLWNLQAVDPGFRTSDILKAEFQLPPSRYPQGMDIWPNWVEAQRFARELRARVGALPGVSAVSVAGDQPLAAGFTSSIRVVGREAEAADWPEPSVRRIDDAYFETMGLRLLAGRRFDTSDGATAPPVIVINAAARLRFFAGRDPLGQQVFLWGQARSVVGVVADERIHGLARTPPPAVYLPTPQAPIAGGSLLVRASVPASSLVAPLRRIVRDLDPSLPLFGVEALGVTLAESVGQRRFTMLVLGVFACAALALAVVGVHGVLSYSVAQRTREMGIRLALGAEPRALRRLVTRQGLVLAAVGLSLGAAGAIAASRALTSMLFGVGTADPVTYVGVALVLGAVAAAASWLPARRASRLNPVEALRAE